MIIGHCMDTFYFSSTKQINESDIEHFFKKMTALITRDNIEFSDIDKILQKNLLEHINGTIDDIMRTVCGRF